MRAACRGADGTRARQQAGRRVAGGKLTPAPAPDPSLRRIPMVRLADIDPDQPGICEDWKSPDFEAMSERFVEGRPVPGYEGIIRSISE